MNLRRMLIAFLATLLISLFCIISSGPALQIKNENHVNGDSGIVGYQQGIKPGAQPGPAPVPEPRTILLLGSGLVGLALYQPKKSNK